CYLDFFFSSRRRHTRFKCDWSSDVCSSDLSLRDGLTRYTWSPWCAGVLATIVSAMREHRDQRDTSIGVSGRHDFGVRSASFVGAAKPRCGALRRSEEHTSELQSHLNLVCSLL